MHIPYFNVLLLYTALICNFLSICLHAQTTAPRHLITDETSQVTRSNLVGLRKHESCTVYVPIYSVEGTSRLDINRCADVSQIDHKFDSHGALLVQPIRPPPPPKDLSRFPNIRPSLMLRRRTTEKDDAIEKIKAELDRINRELLPLGEDRSETAHGHGYPRWLQARTMLLDKKTKLSNYLSEGETLRLYDST